MRGGIRWILFDAVGTLIYADPPVAEVYHAAAQRFGSRLSIEAIRQRFAAGLRAEQSAGCKPHACIGMPTPQSADHLVRPPTSEAAERQRWRRIVATVIDDVANGDELFEQLWRHFAEPRHWRVYDNVPSACEVLRSRGFRVGIASNFDGRLHAIVAAHAALAACEAVFVSSEIGYAKPDPRFFATIQEQLRASPAEIVLIGDDEINDVAGATAAGWRAAYLDRDR
jgi:putative hydrolase of the HAD superfamily